MTKKILSGWSLLFSTEMFIPFVFGGIALSILGNSVFSLLTNWLTTSNWGLIRISLGAFVFIVGSGWLLRKFLYRHQLNGLSIGKKQPDKRKGLILLVSNISTCRKAIEWHQDILDKCWLICTQKSEKIGDELKEDFENISTEFEIITIADKDIFDPLIFKNEVESIYSNLPQFFTENDIILDFTGMTAVASVGSVISCLGKNRPIQYIPAPYNEKLKAVEPLDPIEIELK